MSNKPSEIERLRKVKDGMLKRKIDSFPMTLEQLTQLLDEIDALSTKVLEENAEKVINNDLNTVLYGGKF